MSARMVKVSLIVGLLVAPATIWAQTKTDTGRARPATKTSAPPATKTGAPPLTKQVAPTTTPTAPVTKTAAPAPTQTKTVTPQ